MRGGGGGVQHVVDKKKTLFTFGALGVLNFGHKTQSGIKGGWGCEHWKTKA